MHQIIKTSVCLLFSASISFGANVSITGSVVNSSHYPLKGVSVRLARAGLVTTTGDNGSFALSGTGAVMDFMLPGAETDDVRFIHGKAIVFTVPEDHLPVSLQLFDVGGKRVSRMASATYDKGTYRLPVENGRLSSNLYLLFSRIGNVELSGTIVSCGNRYLFTDINGHHHTAGTVQRRSALLAIDTLCFSKPGYDTLREPIADYATAQAQKTVLPRDKNGASIAICGATGSGLHKNRSSAPVGNMVVAVPSIRGNVDIKEMTCMKMARWFPIPENDTFSVELPKQISVFQPNEELCDVSWILAMIDTTQPTREKQFTGFVSIADPASSLLRLPVDKGVDDVNLGNLERHGDELQSSVDLDSATASFSLSGVALRDIARTDNAAKTVRNAFVNFNRSNGLYYVADPTFVLGNDSLALIFNRFADPSEFFVRDRMAFTVQIDTYDSALFVPAPFCSRTYTMDLYPPVPMHSVSITQYAPNDTSWYRGYFPQFISSDSAVNNALNSTRPNFINPTVLPGCGSEWHKSISFYVGGLFGDIGAGQWLYKKDRDSVFAMYDFGLTLPFDEQGKPFVYIPSIKLTVDTASGILDSLSVKWFTYNSTANRFDEVTDNDAVKRSVSSLIVNPYDNGPPRNLNFSGIDTSAFSMHQKFPAETLYVGKTHEKRIQGITVQFVTCGVHISEDWMIGF